MSAEILNELFLSYGRAVTRSENPGGLVVMGGDNVPPLVEIGLTMFGQKLGGS